MHKIIFVAHAIEAVVLCTITIALVTTSEPTLEDTIGITIASAISIIGMFSIES